MNQSDYEKHGFVVKRCFPGSFKEAWGLASSDDPEADRQAWEDYNIAIEVGHDDFAVLLFGDELHYKASMEKDKALGQQTAVRNPDGTIAVWFKLVGANQTMNQLLEDKSRLIVRGYLTPAPPSRVGDAEAEFIKRFRPAKGMTGLIGTYAPNVKGSSRLRVKPFSFSAIPLRGYMAFQPPEVPLYMEGGMLDYQGRCIVAGEPKVGKSRLALNWAFSLATQRPFLNRACLSIPRILFLQFEVSERRFQERVNSIAKKWKIPVDNDLPIYLLTLPSLRLDTTPGLLELRALVKRTSADIVFLDPLAKLHSGNESDQQEMQALFNNIDELVDELGVAMIIVHHLRKGSGAGEAVWERMRGSSYIPAWVDTGLVIDKRSKEAKPQVHSILRNGENFTASINFEADHTITVLGDFQTTLEVAIQEVHLSNATWNKKQICDKVSNIYGVSIQEVYGVYSKLIGQGKKLPSK